MALSQELQDALAVWRVATLDIELSDQIIASEQAKIAAELDQRPVLEAAVQAAVEAVCALETDGLVDYYYIDSGKLYHLKHDTPGNVFHLQELEVKT